MISGHFLRSPGLGRLDSIANCQGFRAAQRRRDFSYYRGSTLRVLDDYVVGYLHLYIYIHTYIHTYIYTYIN